MLTKSRLAVVLSLWIAFVFVQSLFFKFSDAPETQHIFNTLDAWTRSFGVGGLFTKDGPFSQYVIGSLELIASALVIAGSVLPQRRVLQGFGGLLAMGIMTGAISFHLLSPLGVVVQGDGGTLFVMATLVWISGAVLVGFRKADLLALGRSSNMAPSV